MEARTRNSWSPYAAGAAIGVLETLAMLTAKRPLGITSAFEDSAALLAEKIAPETMDGEQDEQKKAKAPKIDWEVGLVAGVMLGSFLSSRLSRESTPPAVPENWRREVGPSRALRYASAFTGGALMMVGARMAKGCTSGHGISGTMQFAASSWLFDPIIFAVGAAVSKGLFGRKQ
ncbi:MAG: YeeE/YedE thiosulfate transporter family protein [Desulfovibrionales bacterium]